MANNPYYFTDANRTLTGQGLPQISQDLDSIRAYQFEIHFNVPNNVALEDGLILAAKQVSQVGFTTEDIEVHRLNDRVYYPGKASPEELTVTFDNLYKPKVGQQLWQWFQQIYNPVTGKFNTVSDNFKANSATIIQLGPRGDVVNETVLYGVYPKSWKQAEFNYSTNEFHTIEMTFRYDFMDHKDPS